MMIEACLRTLMHGRLFERDIFTEKFLTAADGASAAARSPLFKSIRTGACPWEPESGAAM